MGRRFDRLRRWCAWRQLSRRPQTVRKELGPIEELDALASDTEEAHERTQAFRDGTYRERRGK